MRGPTGHLHHLIAQQFLHNGGLERQEAKGDYGQGAGISCLASAFHVDKKLELANSHEMAVSLAPSPHPYSHSATIRKAWYLGTSLHAAHNRCSLGAKGI